MTYVHVCVYDCSKKRCRQPFISFYFHHLSINTTIHLSKTDFIDNIQGYH